MEKQKSKGREKRDQVLVSKVEFNYGISMRKKMYRKKVNQKKVNHFSINPFIFSLNFESFHINFK